MYKRQTPIPRPTPLTTTNGTRIHSAVLPQCTFQTQTGTQTDGWVKRQVYSSNAYPVLIVSDALSISLFSACWCLCLISVAPLIADSPSELSVSAGQSAQLPCEVSGRPRPQVTWTKNGVRLSSDSDPHYFITESGSLEIFSAHPDDTATYSCTAINVAGVLEKRVMLFVNGQRTLHFLYITRGS